jgi:hypothetical protein
MVAEISHWRRTGSSMMLVSMMPASSPVTFSAFSVPRILYRGWT